MQVTLYDFQGGALQQLDFSAAPDAHDFTCAAFSPSGDVALLGGYNSISSCSFNAQAGAWELAETKQVSHHLTFVVNALLSHFTLLVLFALDFMHTIYSRGSIPKRRSHTCDYKEVCDDLHDLIAW